MKPLISCLISLFLCFSVSSAQTYQVIKIAGSITHCGSKEPLRVEDRVNHNDLLCFTNSEQRFAVASIIDLKSAKRYFIKAGNSSAGIQQGRVSQCLTISRSMSGTRQGKLNTLFDLATFLGSGDFLIPGGELQLELDSSNLAMNSDSFFYASYVYQGDAIPEASLSPGDTINKLLPYRSDTLILTVKALFQIDSASIDPADAHSFALYYYRPGLKKRNLVAEFNPLFIDDELLAKELDIIYAIRSQKDREELEQEKALRAAKLKEELAAYLLEVYNKAEKEGLDQWLNQYLILKGQDQKE